MLFRQSRYGCDCCLLLLRRMEEDYRAVLRSVIRSLSIQLRWVVFLKERIEQVLITHTRWIEGDFEHFRVAGPVRADISI